MRTQRPLNEKLIGFIQLGNTDAPRWCCDARMRHYLRQAGYALDNPNTTALVLLERLRANPDHPEAGNWQRALFYYLQETSWSVAFKLKEKASHGYTLKDYFQDACVFTSQPLTLLRRFDPQRGSLCAYAYQRLYDAVYAALYGARHTDWGLLKHTGPRVLKQALTDQGYAPVHTAQTHLVVHCWKQLVAQPKAPDVTLLAQVTRAYNQGRQHLPALDEFEVEGCLQKAIAALRHYRTPPVVPCLPEEVSETTAGTEPMPWDVALEEEERAYLKQVIEILMAARATLDDSSRQVLCLYYCEQVNQKTIAQQLGFQKQYQVSRCLERIRLHLVKALMAELGCSWTPEQIKGISALIDGWLKGNCKVPREGQFCLGCSDGVGML